MTHAVKLTKIEDDPESLCNIYYQICNFCGKGIKITPGNETSIKKLSSKTAYCSFCLRNNYHFRSSHNVLMMSYRGILGFYYYRFYLEEPRTMWVNQLQAIIDKQVFVGLQHPAFNYDPSTFLWFIDFNKIGNNTSKAPFESVLNTTKSMFDLLDVNLNFKRCFIQPSNDLWEKFSKALVLFYEQRKRPKDRRMLIPTMLGLIPGINEDFLEATRDFCKSNMILT
jgi:hypothetical protein